MAAPSIQVASWLQSVLRHLPATIHAVYVEYSHAYSPSMDDLACFNAFGYESLAEGCFDPSSMKHYFMLGDFSWEPPEDCSFRAADFPDTDWMRVLKNSAESPEAIALAMEHGIQLIVGEHDGDVFRLR